MMKDRLADLTPSTNSAADVIVTPESNIHMERFFKMVEEVRSLVGKISSQVEEVGKKHSAILSAPNPEQRTKDELEHLTNAIKSNANAVRTKLKTMQEGLSQDENANSASVDQRIQKNQYDNLTRWFVDVMTGYNETQMRFREKSISRLRRQLEITGKVTTEEELDEMLLMNNPTIFTSDIVLDARVTRQALDEIEARHEDIMRLESSIRELHEMFVDIAMLVQTQGEMLNSIEQNVSNATEYVASAKGETKKAVRYQKSARRVRLLPSFPRLFKTTQPGPATDPTATDPTATATTTNQTPDLPRSWE